MATNDTSELAVKGLVGGQQHIHTLHFRHIPPGLGEGDLIDSWQANCQAAYKAIFRTDESPVMVIRAAMVCGAVPLRAPVERAVSPSVGTRGVPGGGDQRLPNWLAIMVRETGILAGKSRQGRFFLGGLMEVDTTGNLLDSSAPGTYDDLIDAYVTTLGDNYLGLTSGASDFMLVTHSRKLASAVPPPDCQDSSTEVSGLTRLSAVTSQRSRRPGSGL